ncbi:thermonuclease family protein [Pseudahrensia aquimaris]|uniref:Thermonuclease family protein n=1 Tax=Pseudahrensia aquimaris TaxID=744461 RepID=A0ABW3FEJ4_9HYPH
MVLRAALAASFILLPIAAQAAQIGTCSGGNRAARQVTCIVDGDTGWERGVKWRMAGIDTPERGKRAACSAERRKSTEATKRLIQLMRGGYRLVKTGKTGKYGRVLVRVRLKDGRDAGQVLMREGLAQRWPNRGNPWC